MTQLATTQANELENIIGELPVDKAQALMDYAHYLRQKYTPHPKRGTAAAILETLEEVGPLQFEEGELDSLLNDIEAMRQSELLALQGLALDDLKRVANEQIGEKQQKRHLQLLEKNNLSADEQHELSELRRQADVLMLRKAYAWAVLRWRGYPIPRLEEIPLE